MRKILSCLVISALFILGLIGGEAVTTADASEASNDQSNRGRQEIVRGLLDESGAGFVVVDGFRYRLAPHLVVKNQQGEVVSSGTGVLRPKTMIELVLEGHLVVQIQIMGLPR